MKDHLKNFFTFSKSERNGTIILLSVLTLLLLLRFFLPYLKKDEVSDFSQFKREIEEFKASSEDQQITRKTSFDDKNSKQVIPIKLSPFDPNNLSEKKWLELGLSQKVVKTIKNFEKKGGRFYKKEDLKKIYGLKETDYQRLESFIQIKDNPYSAKVPEIKKPRIISLINLNTADSFQLVSLNGIGPAFASRIIKYRTLLGGFARKEQLMEVFGFSQEIYSKIEGKVEADNKDVRKININLSGIDELKKHPYIKYNIARAIVNYRNQHGNFKNPDDLKKVHLVNEELYLKLAPYLTLLND